MEFVKGKTYTLVIISEMMGWSVSKPIIITGAIGGRTTFKAPGKRKEFYLSYTPKDTMIFEGKMPEGLLIDSDAPHKPTSSGLRSRVIRGNACFNFISDNPQDVKEKIEKYNLNKEFSDFGHILVFPLNDEDNPTILYPELAGGHAVVEGYLQKQKEAI